MFKAIKIEGLGPLDGTFELIAGETTITGRSEVGKSSLLTALCFCLWGTDERGRPLPVEAISDEAGAAGVELETLKGTRFARTMDRERKTTRELYAPGETFAEVFRSEKAWASDALKVLGRELQVGKRRVHAARLIAAPFAWEELASSAGGGRELRDALDAIVGGGEDLAEVVRSLMVDAGEDLEEGDPLDGKGAEILRRRLKVRLDQAEGELQGAEEALREAEAAEVSAGPDKAALARARAVLVDAATWFDHTKDVAEYHDRKAAAGEAWNQWRRRFDELGEKPAFSTLDLAKARENIRPAEARLKGFEMTLSKVRGQLEAFQTPALDVTGRGQLEARLQAYEEHAGKCPECLRRWSGAAEVIEDLRSKLDQGEPEKPAQVIELEAEIARLEGEVQAAEENLQKRRSRVAELEAEEAEVLAWTRRKEAVGVEPAPFVEVEPKAPDLDRPSPEAAAEAEAILKAEAVAEGAGDEREAQLKRLRARVTSAASRRDAAAAAVSRAEALVDAVRRAPSERLKRSLDRLGDLGPVSFHLEGDGLSVYFDGRPHWLASRGRRIYADLCLRLALRRALRMVWFPVWVDDVQSWSEEWPDTTEAGHPTPVVYLQTANQGLRVEGGRP